MSIDLINSVVNGDYVSANKLFEERLTNIREKKLYELKRMMQAEVFGGMSKEDLKKRKDAGFMKAADYYDIMDKLKQVTNQAKNKSTTVVKPKRKKKLEEAYQYQGKSDKDIKSAATGLGQRLGQAIAGAAEAQGKETEDKPKETPRDISAVQKSSTKKPESTAAASWREMSQKRKADNAKKQAQQQSQDRLQKVTNRLVSRSAKGLFRGKNITRNISTLLKHGGKSTVGQYAGKVVGKVGDIASEVGKNLEPTFE